MVVIKCSKDGLFAVICGKILRVYDLRESTLVHKYSFSTDPTKPVEPKDNEGQSSQTTFTYDYGCVFSNSGKYLATFSDGKDLAVLRTTDWKQIGKRKAAKRLTSVLFTNKEDCIVISDKAGDVYSYNISEENGLSNESLLLGHVSIILDMAISRDDRYILTADRDEKIRVSHFPNSYNIESFCLGHTEYVWKIIIPEKMPDILVSASGDDTLRFWDYKHGISVHSNIQLDKPSKVVSCLASSRTENVVFVGFEGSLSVSAFKITREEELNVEQISSADLKLDGPPCCFAVDYKDRLWVVQSYEKQPFVVFEMSLNEGGYEFKRQSVSLPITLQDQKIIYETTEQRPCLVDLKKKGDPGFGASDYYNRKKDRIEAKRKKDASEVQTKKIKT
ncbi:tRNA (guanine-N(7)-)-methyltransferase non-catalytic subunit wdr4-like [Dendronephthya gigantea]|uniref:tRNA (guanine-N(7)-)-methyltransferase non-catalytic subunit wdr4-like n=1 Tax=Dendronephthya gigantea TaxID=151771 RepID=UPI001068FCAF|nr:tRNA (guanine-N(7)-)-methyltransferase non-catalytic subunit wdr4-like [Dendronephthya gigantea]